MAAHPHGPRIRLSSGVPTLGSKEAIALAALLFVGIFALRLSDPNVADSDEILFVVPIALLALQFGVRGGIAGALLAIALYVSWDLTDSVVVSARGYLSCVGAFSLLGTLLGTFVDQRRRLQAELSRYYNASLDML